jgi:hypothetical protein
MGTPDLDHSSRVFPAKSVVCGQEFGQIADFATIWRTKSKLRKQFIKSP